MFNKTRNLLKKIQLFSLSIKNYFLPVWKMLFSHEKTVNTQFSANRWFYAPVYMLNNSLYGICQMNSKFRLITNLHTSIPKCLRYFWQLKHHYESQGVFYKYFCNHHRSCEEFYGGFYFIFYIEILLANIQISDASLLTHSVLSLRILTRKKHSQINFENLRKVWTRTFGSLVHQINSL